MRGRSYFAGGAAVAAILLASGVGLVAHQTAAAAQAQATRPGVVTAYRRLTESQYRNAIRDAFGPAIQIAARFEPERREDGLQAVGNARMSVTASGMEQYYAAARSIADQVADGKDKDALIGCADIDDACAAAFIATRGSQLMRRPLRADEQAAYLDIYKASTRDLGDARKGLKQTIVAMLMSPDFLFRVERAETDPQSRNSLRLDASTKASRISYLLWNSGPDAQLMRAAASGEIHTEAGLKRQVDRMLASPRLEDGVRAFFTDMLQFEAFETLSKDTATYPKFSQAVADSAREETLKFLTHHLVTKQGDYRDVFTARDTYIDRTLAYVYNVPYLSTETWAPYTFDEASERSGLLTQVTFLSLFAHPAASSPTIRGAKLNEIFLCTEVPQPPPDVDFSKVQALDKGTVRVRLLDHMSNEGCAGCHQLTDPPGLALERFDGLGQHRTLENAQPIDVSATIGKTSFNGAAGLGAYLRNDPTVSECLVKRASAYGVGRTGDAQDAAYLARLERTFRSGGYKVPALFRDILTSPEFYRVVLPTQAPARTASLSVGKNSPLGDER